MTLLRFKIGNNIGVDVAKSVAEALKVNTTLTSIDLTSTTVLIDILFKLNQCFCLTIFDVLMFVSNRQ